MSTQTVSAPSLPQHAPTISTLPQPDPRLAKAEAIAQEATTWHRGRLRADGTKFYAVPSSSTPNLYYMVNQRACTCPDFERRQLACKHILAVRIHCARRKAQRPTLSPETARLSARYAEIFGGDA